MAEIRDLPQLVQIIAIVALIAGVMALILDEFQDNQETTTIVVNDTVIFTALGTPYSFCCDTDSNAGAPFLVRTINNTFTVQNSSIGTVNRGNWTVDVSNNPTITATAGEDIIAGSSMNVSYSYTVGSNARNIFEDGLTGLIETTSWLDLIALAVMAGILLVVVMGSVNNYRNNGRY